MDGGYTDHAMGKGLSTFKITEEDIVRNAALGNFRREFNSQFNK